MQLSALVALALALVTVNVSAAPTVVFKARQLGAGFVTEPCGSDSDCQQGCCAFSTSKCAGPVIAQTNGDGGCGGGGGSTAPNCDVATAIGFADQCIAGAQRGPLTSAQIVTAATFVEQLDSITNPITPPSGGASAPPAAANDASSSGAATSSAALGSNFVTEPCTSDAECQQGCCAFSTGLCAGPAVAQTNADGGCGHGQPTPNCQVAHALGLNECVAGGNTQGILSQSQLTTAVKFVANLDGLALPAAFAG
jgi:hypothetical protein